METLGLRVFPFKPPTMPTSPAPMLHYFVLPLNRVGCITLPHAYDARPCGTCVYVLRAALRANAHGCAGVTLRVVLGRVVLNKTCIFITHADGGLYRARYCRSHMACVYGGRLNRALYPSGNRSGTCATEAAPPKT